MKALLLIFLTTSLAWGNSLKDQLFRELSETGQTNFTDLETALIVSGVEDPETLQTYIEKYKALGVRFKLSDKQLKQSPKKKARTVHKKVFSYLKRENNEITGLLETLDNGSYSQLSATWLYVAMSLDAGLVSSAYATMMDGLDPYFLNTEGMGLKDIAASFLTASTTASSHTQPEASWRSLKLASLLSPQSTHGTGTYDVQLYNQALKLFNGESYVTAAWVAAGASLRYPALKEFQGLCYNIGVKLFQGTIQAGNWDEAVHLGRLLEPYTGQYMDGFRQTLATVYFNHAVALYNAGKFEETLERLEHASPAQEGYNDLLTGSLNRMIDKAVDKDDREALATLLPRLEEVNPERAQSVKTRLSQLKLRDLDESGKLEEALALAANDLETELGRNNYISVLTRYSQSKRQESLDVALTLLEDVPAPIKGHKTLKTLRFNAYAVWLNKYEDKEYEQVIPLFQRIFGDKELELGEEDRKVFTESYGNALYFEIQKLIEDRDFQKANEKSKQALTMVKNHKALLDQRKLMDTIMKRISE